MQMQDLRIGLCLGTGKLTDRWDSSHLQMAPCLAIKRCNCVEAASEFRDCRSKGCHSLCHALQRLPRPHGIATDNLR